jgi:hypothetical protein
VRWNSTYPAGVRQEVGTDWLDITVSGLAKVPNRLEVLLAGPALRQDRERQ